MVAPLTTTMRRIPSAVPLEPAMDGVPQSCVVSLDSVQAIRKQWLDAAIVRLRPAKMSAVDRAQHFALGFNT